MHLVVGPAVGSSTLLRIEGEAVGARVGRRVRMSRGARHATPMFLVLAPVARQPLGHLPTPRGARHCPSLSRVQRMPLVTGQGTVFWHTTPTRPTAGDTTRKSPTGQVVTPEGAWHLPPAMNTQGRGGQAPATSAPRIVGMAVIGLMEGRGLLRTVGRRLGLAEGRFEGPRVLNLQAHVMPRAAAPALTRDIPRGQRSLWPPTGPRQWPL